MPPHRPDNKFPRPRDRHSRDALPLPYLFPRVRPSTSCSVNRDWSNPTAANSQAYGKAFDNDVSLYDGNAYFRAPGPPVKASSPTTSRSRGTPGNKGASTRQATIASKGAGAHSVMNDGVPSMTVKESRASSEWDHKALPVSHVPCGNWKWSTCANITLTARPLTCARSKW